MIEAHYYCPRAKLPPRAASLVKTERFGSNVVLNTQKSVRSKCTTEIHVMNHRWSCSVINHSSNYSAFLYNGLPIKTHLSSSKVDVRPLLPLDVEYEYGLKIPSKFKRRKNQ